MTNEDLRIPHKEARQVSQHRLEAAAFEAEARNGGKWDAQTFIDAMREYERPLGDMDRSNWLEIERHWSRFTVPGSATVFDCTIDSTLSANSPSTHQYVNLSGVLANETTISTKMLVIGVIGRPGTTITETGTLTINGPISMVCLGNATAASGNLGGPSANARQIWDLAGHPVTGAALYGVYLQGLDVASSVNMSAFTVTCDVMAFDCSFRGATPASAGVTRGCSAIANTATGSAWVYLVNCWITDIEAQFTTGRTYYFGCTYSFGALNAGTAWTPSLGGNFHGDALTFTCTASSASKGIVIATASNTCNIATAGNSFIGGSNATLPLTINTSAGTVTNIDFQGQGQVTFAVSVSAASGDTIVRGDQFSSVLCSGNSNSPLSLRYFDTQVTGGATFMADLTGPCQAKVHSIQGVNSGTSEVFILRGTSIFFEGSGTSRTANAKLQLIACTESLILMEFLKPTGSGVKAYAIDASSARCLLVTAGSTQANWSVASTNAGTNCTVITETGTTPSGSAGGDLTGTYPNPTIAANAVTNAKLAQAPTLTLKGNNTGGTANELDLTVAQVNTMLGTITSGSAAGGDLTGTYPNPTLAAIIAAGGPTGDATHVAQITYDAKGRLTAVSSVLITGVTPGGAAGGDLTGTYPNPTIDVNKVTNAKLAQAPAFTMKGNNTSGVANELDLTVAQVQALLGIGAQSSDFTQMFLLMGA